MRYFKKLMLKKSIKYIFIATINWFLLWFLLEISTDKFDIRLKESYVENMIITISLITFLSLIGMRVFAYLVRKRALQKTTKIKIAVAITILISSFLYVHLLIKYKNDIIGNNDFRNHIALKIQKSDWFYGTKAKNLTIKEYQEIKKTNWFPNLPKEATNIDYYYEYEGFLPDYTFTLEYNLPKDIEVENISYEKDGFSKTQSFVLYKSRKRVTYGESLQ